MFLYFLNVFLSVAWSLHVPVPAFVKNCPASAENGLRLGLDKFPYNRCLLAELELRSDGGVSVTASSFFLAQYGPSAINMILYDDTTCSVPHRSPGAGAVAVAEEFPLNIPSTPGTCLQGVLADGTAGDSITIDGVVYTGVALSLTLADDTPSSHYGYSCNAVTGQKQTQSPLPPGETRAPTLLPTQSPLPPGQTHAPTLLPTLSPLPPGQTHAPTVFDVTTVDQSEMALTRLLPMIVGIGGGGFLLCVLLIVGVACFCATKSRRRRRRSHVSKASGSVRRQSNNSRRTGGGGTGAAATSMRVMNRAEGSSSARRSSTRRRTDSFARRSSSHQHIAILDETTRASPASNENSLTATQ